MHLQNVLGIQYVMQRVYPIGTPSACGERTVATCETGIGCHVGVCSGTSGCDAASSESSCTNRTGCTWNASDCGGSAASECNFEDYGTVPGCALQESSS